MPVEAEPSPGEDAIRKLEVSIERTATDSRGWLHRHSSGNPYFDDATLARVNVATRSALPGWRFRSRLARLATRLTRGGKPMSRPVGRRATGLELFDPAGRGIAIPLGWYIELGNGGLYLVSVGEQAVRCFLARSPSAVTAHDLDRVESFFAERGCVLQEIRLTPGHP